MEGKRHNLWLKVTAVLSAVAFGLCLWMAFATLSGAGMPGCSGSGGCGSALSSRWAMVLGVIPVSALAAGLYLILTTILAFLAIDAAKGREKLLWAAATILSGAIAGSAAWFLGVLAFELHTLCIFCLAAHVVGLSAAAGVLLLGARLNPAGRRTAAFFCGIALAGCLAALQLGGIGGDSRRGGTTRDPLPYAALDGTPCIGNPDAGHVLELLFDYRCSHCRNLHPLIREVVERSDGRLAVLLCPTPLSTACNPYVRATVDLYKGSCELAQIALAIWKVDKDIFTIFDDWLFACEEDAWTPREPEEAMRYASSLVGEERLREALSDATVRQSIALYCELFGRTFSSGGGGIPRIICGSGWIMPEATDADGLEAELSEAFGLGLDHDRL